MNQVRCEETDESKLDSLSSSATCWVCPKMSATLRLWVNWPADLQRHSGWLSWKNDLRISTHVSDLASRWSPQIRITRIRPSVNHSSKAGEFWNWEFSELFTKAEIFAHPKSPTKKCLELHNFFFLASNLAKTATSVGASRNQHPSDGKSFPLL